MFLTLVRKDLVQELRTREGFTFIAGLSLIFAVVLSLGINSSGVNPGVVERLFPSMLWICFLFTASCTVSRSLDADLQHMALEGLLLLGVPAATIFCSKTVSNSVVTGVGLLFSLALLSVLLNISVAPHLNALLFIGALVVLGYAALATVTVGIAGTSSAKSLLLPLILLPLLFPLFFAASELTAELFAHGRLDYSSFWLSLLVGLDVLYMVLGLNLYEFVIQE